MITNALKMSVGSLEYYAVLTADTLRWTAPTGFEKQIQTIKAYDLLPPVAFCYKQFAGAVKLAGTFFYGSIFAVPSSVPSAKSA